MHHAMMMAGMMTAGIMVPMMFKAVTVMAGKALILSKIAILMAGAMLLKKMMQPQQMSRHELDVIPAHVSLSRRSSFNNGPPDEAYTAYREHHIYIR